MKAPLLTVAAIIALTGALVSCGDTEEAAPVPTETATSRAAISPSPGMTPEATIPADLPTAADGYEWYVAPSDSAVPFAAQIPQGWEQRGGGGQTHFVPPGTASNFPYSDVPG